MARGMIKNPGWVKSECQYCGKEFDYYREYATIKRSCYDCVPKGSNTDAALLRRLTKIKAIKHKGGKCQCCGQEFVPCVFDFHHLDPSQKDFSLGDKTSSLKWVKIDEELKKCILVCSNCHRMIHSGDLIFKEQ